MIIALFFFFFALLLLVGESLRSLRDNGTKLDNIAEMMVRNNNLLTHITQAVHLSDTAKEIAFREKDQLELGDATLSKLHQHDFEAALAMIEAMEQSNRYRELGSKLRKMAEKYRAATEEGRVQQIIHYIESLMEQRRWSQAAAQINSLLKFFPYSEKAKIMPHRLREYKDLRKGELLCDWDNALQANDVDRSLETLKELDQYLTPAEALSLQESARKVFKAKLENLAAEFKNAVSERNWIAAVDIGKQIEHNFPNSRMASEIRSKMDILQEHAQRDMDKIKEIKNT